MFAVRVDELLYEVVRLRLLLLVAAPPMDTTAPLLKLLPLTVIVVELFSLIIPEKPETTGGLSITPHPLESYFSTNPSLSLIHI